jgi:hypothetical protein
MVPALGRFLRSPHAGRGGSWKFRTPFHEPTRPSNCSLPWESRAEDARTPDASRLPGASEPREASGVRPIYRRFPSGAGRPTVHGPNACGKNERGLSMNRLVAQAFQPAGSPDFRVWWTPNGRLESRPNPQARKPALRTRHGSWSRCTPELASGLSRNLDSPYGDRICRENFPD